MAFQGISCYTEHNKYQGFGGRTMRQEEIQRLCQLAKLTLETEEQQELGQEMDEIIVFARAVCETASGLPEETTQEGQAPLREDQVEKFQAAQELLRNTEESKEGFFFLSGKR